jgi:hypothetical protein
MQDLTKYVKYYLVTGIMFNLFNMLSLKVGVYALYHFKIIKCSLLSISVLSIISFILVHWWFNVDTTLNYMLGLSNKPKRYKNNFKLFEVVSI